MHVVGKMSKDIGMEVHKGTVVSFIPTLFGCFLGIPSLYAFSFFFLNVFFVTCFSCFLGGWRYRAIDPQYVCIMEYGSTPYIGTAPKKWLPHWMCAK